MTAGILIALYAVETIIYYYVYYILYGTALKRYYLPFVGGIVFSIFWLVWGSKNPALAIMVIHFFPIAVAFLVPRVSVTVRITRTFIAFFVVNCVSELLLTLADGILHLVKLSMSSDMKQLIVYSIQLFVFGVIIILKKHLPSKVQSEIKFWSQRNVIYAVIFMALSVLLAISGLKWAGRQIDNPVFQSLTLIICVLANIGVCMLGLFSVYVDNINRKMEELIDNEKRIRDMQVRYYDALLEREEDTRKYRHDMGNHLICMERLIKQGDITAVENYLFQMQQKMEEIQKRCFSTGNDILDVLTNHYVNLLRDGTAVNVNGRIHTTMDQMQLCTIYANLLQNAVEEVNRCTVASWLDIAFTQGKEFFQIVIKNSLSETSKKLSSDKLLTTSKKDKRNHGIGLLNVRKTVEEVGGILEIQKSEEAFCAVVVLKVNE